MELNFPSILINSKEITTSMKQENLGGFLQKKYIMHKNFCQYIKYLS